MKTRIYQRLLALGLSSTVGLTSLAAQTTSAPPVPTFRSSADLVSIQASVRDKRGRP